MSGLLANAGLALLLMTGGAAWAAVIDQAVRSFAQHGRIDLHAHEARSYLERLTMADPGHHWIDRVLFRLAMPVAAMAIALGAIVLPIGPSTATLPGPQLAVGLFFYLVVLDVMAVALFMAGWGANQHAGTNGAFVVGAQLVSYLIPLGFAITGAVMAAESLATTDVVLHQRVAYGVWQPFGLAIYLASAMGQTYRAPVDLPLAGSDADVGAEYRGAARALLEMCLYAIWFLAAAMGALVFLSGWRGPWIPGPVWFLLKTSCLVIVMAWLGVRFRRLTVPQMIRGAWLILIPASILNVIVVGVLIMLAS